MNDEVKKYWEQQAIEHGAADTATAPDSYYRDLEIRSIIPHINGPNVLDVGCGNGFSTNKFATRYPDWNFTGVDYAHNMIVEAQATETRCDFFVADVRDLSEFKGKYDCVISERCLINLLSWGEQKSALEQMLSCLRPSGKLILVENFIEGLGTLNQLREKVGLHPIAMRWHNRYLHMSEFDEWAEKNCNTRYAENIGNMYYIVSRVVYAAIAKEQGMEPDYLHPINKIAAQLPTLGKFYFSPNMLIVLERR